MPGDGDAFAAIDARMGEVTSPRSGARAMPSTPCSDEIAVVAPAARVLPAGTGWRVGTGSRAPTALLGADGRSPPRYPVDARRCRMPPMSPALARGLLTEGHAVAPGIASNLAYCADNVAQTIAEREACGAASVSGIARHHLRDR